MAKRETKAENFHDLGDPISEKVASLMNDSLKLAAARYADSKQQDTNSFYTSVLRYAGLNIPSQKKKKDEGEYRSVKLFEFGNKDLNVITGYLSKFSPPTFSFRVGSYSTNEVNSDIEIAPGMAITVTNCLILGACQDTEGARRQLILLRLSGCKPDFTIQSPPLGDALDIAIKMKSESVVVWLLEQKCPADKKFAFANNDTLADIARRNKWIHVADKLGIKVNGEAAKGASSVKASDLHQSLSMWQGDPAHLPEDFGIAGGQPMKKLQASLLEHDHLGGSDNGTPTADGGGFSMNGH